MRSRPEYPDARHDTRARRRSFRAAPPTAAPIRAGPSRIDCPAPNATRRTANAHTRQVTRDPHPDERQAARRGGTRAPPGECGLCDANGRTRLRSGPDAPSARGRIVFNRMCADEEPYRVKAYARMESPDGRARAVAAVLAGYRATGGRTVFVDVRLQRLKLDAGKAWRDVEYAIRLTGRGARGALDGPMVGSYVGGAQGQEPAYRQFGTDERGTADWMTFVEPDDRTGNTDHFHYFGPELSFKAPDLGVEGPQDEFDLALVLRNEANGRALRAPRTAGTGAGTNLDHGASHAQGPRIGRDAESRPGRRIVQLPGAGLEVPQVHRGARGRQGVPRSVRDGNAGRRRMRCGANDPSGSRPVPVLRENCGRVTILRQCGKNAGLGSSVATIGSHLDDSSRPSERAPVAAGAAAAGTTPNPRVSATP